MKIKLFAFAPVVFAGAMIFALAGCTGNSNNASAPATNTTSIANSSSPVMQPELYAQQKMAIASLTQAVQQYNVSEGHYPSSLQDLAPNYIAKIPQAPPGSKFNYDPNTGAVTVGQQ